jgi:hypothetical protein
MKAVTETEVEFGWYMPTRGDGLEEATISWTKLIPAFRRKYAQRQGEHDGSACLTVAQ